MDSSQSKSLYHREYFVRQVDGHREFARFDGSAESLFERYRRNLELLDVSASHRLLDVGCGRGEVVIHHALRGGESMGIDYSEAAIGLAIEKAAALGARCDFRAGSFDTMPREPLFDRMLASEFIEHISPAEGARFWALAHQALKPGGRLLVYTAPNTLQRRFGYPVERLLVFASTGRLLPKLQPDMLNEHYRLYHLNEQTLFNLRRSARQAGFRRARVFYDMPGARPRTLLGRLFQAVFFRGPSRHLFLGNLVCVAEK